MNDENEFLILKKIKKWKWKKITSNYLWLNLNPSQSKANYEPMMLVFS